VLAGIAIATLAGSYWLTNGPHSAIEGARDWREESLLRAVTHVLNLDFSQTTAEGVDIKWLVFGVGSGLAAVVAGLSLCVRSPLPQSVEEGVRAGGDGDSHWSRKQIPPLPAAQVLLALYVTWSFLSALWSGVAKDIALGGSIQLAYGAVWALVLGRGLNRRMAVAAAYAVVVVCAVTALLAIFYYGERNPTRRASYPIGNPLFLAACLIPGLLLACSMIGSAMSEGGKASGKRVAVAVGGTLAGGLIVWATVLTSARSSYVAVLFGVVMMVFWRVSPAQRRRVGIGAVLLAAASGLYVSQQARVDSSTGRDASLRLRFYAWSYASDLAMSSWLVGHGQGGFTRLADPLAVDDVLDDPQSLGSRVAHAHNEWLQVWADLGFVGLLLVLGALGMTVAAGSKALGSMPEGASRWLLIGLMATLVALVIEEGADTALRVAGLPVAFYTVIGLIWAIASGYQDRERGGGSISGSVRFVPGVGAILVGTVLAWAAWGDFTSARAYFDLTETLQRREFEKASVLADRAVHGRLSPQRRLMAFERRCSTHLIIAESHRAMHLDRLRRAQLTDPPDPVLSRLAEEDLQACRESLAAAIDALESLVARAPGFWNSGWLEYRLIENQVILAYAAGATEAGDALLEAGAEALGRELQRRPFDPQIAVAFADAAGHATPLDALWTVLARPLRYANLTPDYTAYLRVMTADPAFDDAFAPVFDHLMASAEGEGGAADPYLPEKLRLAALVSFLRSDFEQAISISAKAGEAYRKITVRQGAMGPGVWLGELAEYTLLADVERCGEAIGLARESLVVLPESTPGRQFGAIVRNRIVVYQLACGDEEGARVTLRGLNETVSDERIDIELGRRYSALVRSLIRGAGSGELAPYREWIERSLALSPENELAWRLSAQLAYDAGEFEVVTPRLRKSLEYGADPGVVFAFVAMASRAFPEISDFDRLEGELRGAGFGASATSEDEAVVPSGGGGGADNEAGDDVLKEAKDVSPPE
jgi:O-antigen ligase/tetratricopeptide (TPR) repeat protein